MMLLNPPTNIALRQTFSRVLNGILDGTLDCAPEGNGLDNLTNAALNDLTAQLRGGEISPPGLHAAYEVFGAQLSGEHADAAEAALLEMLRLSDGRRPARRWCLPTHDLSGRQRRALPSEPASGVTRCGTSNVRRWVVSSRRYPPTTRGSGSS